MQKHILRGWIALFYSLLWLNVFGCAAPKPQRASYVSPPASPSSPEKTKVIVLRLENAVKKGRADKSSLEDRLFGNGIRAQLITALEQSGRFTVLTNSGPREVLQRETLTDTGEIKKPIRERLGSLGDAEFLIAGVITSYQLSKESKNAGVEADLFFREAQAKTVNVEGSAIVEMAKKEFEGLKVVSQDRVALELWLFEAKTGKRLATTKIEGTPSDSGEKLATSMQQAVRGATTKAVSWMGETERTFRAGLLPAEPKRDASLELDTEKASKPLGKKTLQSVTLPRSTTKIQPQSIETESLLPPSSAAEAGREDFSESPAVGSKPAPKAEKPTSLKEEWGSEN